MARKRQFTISEERYRSKGAFVTLEQLLEQRYAARSLDPGVQTRGRLGMAGTHLSKTKGRGVDFEEHRPYQPGDDIRTIDWRVTARTGKPFVKVFREERERPVIIGVDQGHNMFFGSQVAFKSVVAAEAAALLCWTTVDIGDRVGGVVFNEQQQSLVKPRRSKRSALRFLNTLAEYNQGLLNSGHLPPPEGSSPLKAALEQIHRITRPGSNVYLISDFHHLEGCQDYLQRLSLHNNVCCLFVYDALEENLPLPGVYSITDGRRRSAIDTSSARTRKLYHDTFVHRLEQLESEFKRLQIPLVPLRGDRSVLEQLEIWKHRIH